MNKFSMAKISILVSITLFSILAATIIIILNFARSGNGDGSDEERLRVGLLLNGRADDRSWGQSHYDSLERVSAQLSCDLICRENVPEDENCTGVISELIEQENCDAVIADSYGFGEYIAAAAAKYPEIYFLHASGSGSGRNLGSFFGRMYQFRYLTGIIAGLSTKSGTIGYTAAFPIDEVNRGINAFTLGVRSVNPDAQVVVSFCGSWTEDETAAASTEKLITEYGADIIAMHTNSLAPHETAARHGVWSVGYNYDNSGLYPYTYLTASVWEWDGYYSEQILSVKQGKFHGEHKWLGIESGIMKLVEPAAAAEKAPGYKEYVEAAEARFRDFSCDVFYGPVSDNAGNVRVPDGESMSDDTMLGGFDWYVEGVRVV